MNFEEFIDEEERMKIYKTQKEFEAKIKDNIFYSPESIDITAFDLDVEADIEVDGDIRARNIKAEDIKADDINANDINADNINAGDIRARNINAWNIRAWNINVQNIKAEDINAKDINAEDINAEDIKARNIWAKKVEYYAVAFAYYNIKVESIKGTRENSRHFVLDGKIEVEED